MATSKIHRTYFDYAENVHDNNIVTVNHINHVVVGNLAFFKCNITTPSTEVAEYTEILSGLYPSKDETSANVVPNESLGTVANIPSMYVKTSGKLTTRSKLPANKHFWINLTYQIS